MPKGIYERHSHGMSNTSTYKTWEAIIDRCFNEKNASYKRYGANGIFVCLKWLKFEGFLSDMGIRPERKEIDRIDNEKGYFKSNCRWVTHKENNNNRKNNLIVEHDGIIKSVYEWAKLFSVSYITIWRWCHKGRKTSGKVYLSF